MSQAEIILWTPEAIPPTLPKQLIPLSYQEAFPLGIFRQISVILFVSSMWMPAAFSKELTHGENQKNQETPPTSQTAPGLSPSTENAPPPVEQITPETPLKSSKSTGLLGDWVLGPKISLLHLPRPLTIGVEARYAKWLGLSLDYGFLPSIGFPVYDSYTYTSSTLSVGSNSISAAARIFPFKGILFLGTHVGYQSLSGTVSADIQGLNTTFTASANMLFLSPHLGWQWVTESGFFTSMELGWQFTLTCGTSITTDHPSLASHPDYIEGKQLAQTILREKVGNFFESVGLPNLAILQFGYFF